MDRIRTGLALVALILAACGAEPTHDSTVVTAARQAMEAELTAIVQPVGSPCPADDATWGLVRKQAIDRVSRYYGDPERSRLLALLLRDGNRQGCSIGGGVEWFNPGAQTISGNSATLQAHAGIWSRFRSPNLGMGTSEPHAVEDCTFQLVRANGLWLVSNSVCKFADGSGP